MTRIVLPYLLFPRSTVLPLIALTIKYWQEPTTAVSHRYQCGIITDHLADNFNVQRLHSNTIYSLLIAPETMQGIGSEQETGYPNSFREEDKFGGYKLQTPEDGQDFQFYPIYTGDNENVLLGTAKSLVLVNLKTSVKKDLPSPTVYFALMRFKKVSDGDLEEWRIYSAPGRSLLFQRSYMNLYLKSSLKHTELRAF